MTARLLAVVGSGSFARSICHALAALAPAGAPIRVIVLARNGAAAEQVVRGCRDRAGIPFTSEGLDDEAAAVARLRPDVLVCAASAQSPYERVTEPSGWTSLVERAGFGITLPFQAELVVRLARVIARSSPDTLLVNGCFPDAVNPLLAALGLPVHCGIGNVATLAACLRAGLDLADQRELAVLGHHTHLAPPDEQTEEVRAWLAGAPLPDVTALLAAYRALPRRELNATAGQAAAHLLLDMLCGKEIRTSLPGPLGLPGGYPVRLAGRSLALNLPAGLRREDAIEWNRHAGRRDGLEIRSGWIRYTARAATDLDKWLPEIAPGWPVSALDDVGEAFSALRRRLRLRRAEPAQV